MFGYVTASAEMPEERRKRYRRPTTAACAAIWAGATVRPAG